MPHEKPFRPRPATPPHGPGEGKKGRPKLAKPYADPGQDPVRNTDGIMDIFAGSKFDYDPNAVYSRATNSHDHSSKMSFGLPGPIVGCMQEIVDRHPEMRSTADFVRDAIIHRLQYFYETSSGEWIDLEWVEQERVISRRMAEQARFMEQVDFITARSEYFQVLADHREWESLLRHLDIFEDDIIAFQPIHQRRGHGITEDYRRLAIRNTNID